MEPTKERRGSISKNMTKQRSTSELPVFVDIAKPKLVLDEAESAFLWVAKEFEQLVASDASIAAAIAAVKILTEVVKKSKANTMHQLEKEIKTSGKILRNLSDTVSISSGCELVLRFVTRAAVDSPDFDKFREKLISLGEEYVEQVSSSREKIARVANSFIRDGVRVLIHGFSRVVLTALLRAAKNGKSFTVFATEARPDAIGGKAAKILEEAKIPVTIVMDSAVAYIMDSIDLVIVGSEGIVENGGIVNQIGTYQISIVASAFKKPFYVAAESFKFMRMFPLNQKDLGSANETHQTKLCTCNIQNQPEITAPILNPRNDYTPPNYITLLFTDLGVLTPSAVSDELIKLYY